LCEVLIIIFEISSLFGCFILSIEPFRFSAISYWKEQLNKDQKKTLFKNKFTLSKRWASSRKLKSPNITNGTETSEEWSGKLYKSILEKI